MALVGSEVATGEAAAAVAELEHEAPVAPTQESRGGAGGKLFSVLVVLICAVFFIFPLLAMGRFAFQSVPMVRLGASTLFKNWSWHGITDAFHQKHFSATFTLSMWLALGTVVLTLALLLPTTLWVHLRVPRARAFVEFLTVLPYVIPPIALVAGIRVIQPHVIWFLDSNYSLIPFYVVLALPFTFRALDAGIRAVDIRTLVDASRSLGAGWGTTFRRALIPNLRTAIISSSFLTVAVVLGEFTIARVLLKDTLPVFLFDYEAQSPQGGLGFGLVLLVATTALFGLLTVVTRKRGAARAVTVF